MIEIYVSFVIMYFTQNNQLINMSINNLLDSRQPLYIIYFVTQIVYFFNQN